MRMVAAAEQRALAKRERRGGDHRALRARGTRREHRGPSRVSRGGSERWGCGGHVGAPTQSASGSVASSAITSAA